MLFVGDVSRKDPRSVNYLPEISRIISSEHQFSHDFHLLSHSVSSLAVKPRRGRHGNGMEREKR